MVFVLVIRLFFCGDINWVWSAALVSVGWRNGHVARWRTVCRWGPRRRGTRLARLGSARLASWKVFLRLTLAVLLTANALAVILNMVFSSFG